MEQHREAIRQKIEGHYRQLDDILKYLKRQRLADGDGRIEIAGTLGELLDIINGNNEYRQIINRLVDPDYIEYEKMLEYLVQVAAGVLSIQIDEESGFRYMNVQNQGGEPKRDLLDRAIYFFMDIQKKFDASLAHGQIAAEVSPDPAFQSVLVSPEHIPWAIEQVKETEFVKVSYWGKRVLEGLEMFDPAKDITIHDFASWDYIDKINTENKDGYKIARAMCIPGIGPDGTWKYVEIAINSNVTRAALPGRLAHEATHAWYLNTAVEYDSLDQEFQCLLNAFEVDKEMGLLGESERPTRDSVDRRYKDFPWMKWVDEEMY